jgi:MFS family permease
MSKFFRKELLYGLVVMLAPINFGLCMGFPSPAIPEFNQKWPSVSETQTTWFNAIMSLFAFIGPFISSFLLKYVQRRMVISILAVASAIFWAVLLAMNEKRFALGIVVRALLGLCVGGFSAMSPMLLVEVAPKEISGFFGNLNQIGIVLGIIWMYLQGNWKSWTTLSITGIVVSVVLTFAIWLIPDTTPVLDESKPLNTENPDSKESVLSKEYFGKLCVGIAMMIIQQFSGVNAIITNLDQNFKDIGVPLDSGIASTISVVAQLIAVFLCGVLVDKFGRRPLFCISCLGCGICLFLFAINEIYNWANWLPIVLIFCYMLFFGVALGPVPWFVIPELFPDSIRSTASSIISCSNWICSFLVIFIYPPIKNAITNKYTLVLFGCVAVLGAVFGWFFITEPKNKGADDQVDNEAANEAEADAKIDDI